MYATQFVSDAAVFPPQRPRGFGLQPNDEKPAKRRSASLLASLRERFASRAPSQTTSPRG